MTNNNRVVFTGVVAFLLGISGCSGPDAGPAPAPAPAAAPAPETGEAQAASPLLPDDAIDRLAERSAPRFSAGAAAPSFIVDPTWPKPLPDNWRIGQVGGIAVDQHDNVWVYHRPRSLSSSAAAGLGGLASQLETYCPDGVRGVLAPYYLASVLHDILRQA